MASTAPTSSTPAPTTTTPATTTTQPTTNSSLYVGDLDRDATEASLFELFSQVGPVASIRVCRDAVTRRSLGYAYVNYNSALDPQAAERALETLNYHVVSGRPIRIMWSHRDPAFRKSGVGNIFIKNLDKSIDNKALHDTFSQFGNILSCKVAADMAGNSRGYAFVHYETDEAAQLAIDKVNGMQLADKIVYVGPFLKRVERGGDGREERFTNVYIKNLNDDVDDEGLRKICAEHGAVTSAVVMTDGNGKSRGFGFVNFETAEGAGAAVDALNGKELDGKTVFAGRAQKKAEREALLRAKFEEVRAERVAKYQGMNLYIKNLADDVTDDQMREEFAPYGTITSHKARLWGWDVMVDDKGKTRGFGFVCYTSHEEATRAVTEMNGKMLKGKPLYVALAQRKEVRRAQLQQQLNQQRMQMAAAAGGPGRGVPGMFPAGAPGPMFYPGPLGPQAGPRPGMMYPGMMGPPGRMGGRGRMGPPGLVMAQPGMMVGGPMAGPMGGRGGRGRGPRGQMPEGVYVDGGRGRGFEGRAARGRGAARGARGGPGAPPPPPPVAAGASAAPAEPAAPAQPQSLATLLANASPEQAKQMLGEQLFPKVEGLNTKLAGKITGMLLEMDNSEVVMLLEEPAELSSKVNEAIEVLKQHGALPEGEAE
ncbi:MAG: polyadenylate-binding protein 4 [Monoraphidium minutum]|nr:MAG: polyadenylate-binding protein 4 [Monoraphidium minutum]